MSNGAMKPTSNIITRSYKHGSIIYFEGDRSDDIYILKGGRVVLTSIKVDTGEELKENIKLGEFFGVKSTIGRYPREETAQTIGDTTVLVVNRADFEKMILKNVPLVTKMLRVFSNQLRRIHKMVRESLGETDSINPAAELFKIGEYYYKSGASQQAIHAYKKYLEYYPGTKFSDQAMKRIQIIETGGEDSDLDSDLQHEEAAPETKRRDDIDLTDFSVEDEKDEGESDGFDLSDKPSKESVSDEIDDIFSEDDIKKGGDDFSLDSDEPKSQEITEMFYEAVSLFSQELFNEALSLYSKVLEFKTLKNDSERSIFEKAHFEIGRCYLKIGKYGDAVNSLSTMIKKFPRSDYVKNSYLHIGIAYEMAQKIDKAIAYYNKVISMEPKDSITKLAQKRLKSLEK